MAKLTKQQRKIRDERRKINQIKGSKYRNGLEKRATKHELIFKEALIDCGIKFQFQKLYYSQFAVYILDFYLKTDCGRYSIEIDGKTHDELKQKEYDKKRSNWMLVKRKTKTIRFTNEQVENDLKGCITQVLLLGPQKIEIKM